MGGSSVNVRFSWVPLAPGRNRSTPSSYPNSLSRTHREDTQGHRNAYDAVSLWFAGVRYAREENVMRVAK
jgi:hypothetical protein